MEVRAGIAPLVGRDGALAELASVLDSARTAHGAVALVTGAAGIGKTRLAEEACARAEGFRVVWCWCGTPTRGPLHPWLQVVRTLAGSDADTSRAAGRSPYLRERRGLDAWPSGSRADAAASATEREQLHSFRRTGARSSTTVLSRHSPSPPPATGTKHARPNATKR